MQGKDSDCINCGWELDAVSGECENCGGPFPIDTNPNLVFAKIEAQVAAGLPESFEEAMQWTNRLGSLGNEYLRAGGKLEDLQKRFEGSPISFNSPGLL